MRWAIREINRCGPSPRHSLHHQIGTFGWRSRPSVSQHRSHLLAFAANRRHSKIKECQLTGCKPIDGLVLISLPQSGFKIAHVNGVFDQCGDKGRGDWRSHGRSALINSLCRCSNRSSTRPLEQRLIPFRPAAKTTSSITKQHANVPQRLQMFFAQWRNGHKVFQGGIHIAFTRIKCAQGSQPCRSHRPI
jgi:hypothetical protein